MLTHPVGFLFRVPPPRIPARCRLSLSFVLRPQPISAGIHRLRSAVVRGAFALGVPRSAPSPSISLRSMVSSGCSAASAPLRIGLSIFRWRGFAPLVWVSLRSLGGHSGRMGSVCFVLPAAGGQSSGRGSAPLGRRPAALGSFAPALAGSLCSLARLVSHFALLAPLAGLFPTGAVQERRLVFFSPFSWPFSLFLLFFPLVLPL